MVGQSDHLAQGGSPPKIQNTSEGRMVVGLLANLDEQESVPKMIHDRLITGGLPPLDGVIVLASRDDDPKGEIGSGEAPDGGGKGFFPRGKMDFPPAGGQSTGNLKARGQKLNEAIQAVLRLRSAFVD